MAMPMHTYYLRRERIVGAMNKALLPIVGDNDNFKEAAPLLFGTEFAKKTKEMVEQVKAMRSAITKKPDRKPPFFRSGPPQQSGGLQPTLRKGQSPELPSKREAIPGEERPIPVTEKNSELVHVCPKDIDNSNGTRGRRTSSADSQPAGGRKIRVI